MERLLKAGRLPTIHARMSEAEILRHWQTQAKRHGIDPAASWSDIHAIELELREMCRRIADGQKVLEVGCANGFTTLRLAGMRRIEILGVDLAPEMIEQAQLALEGLGDDVATRVRFVVGDATALDLGSDTYDIVLVKRVLINLGSWERQLMALAESIRVLRPGGRLLLSEATIQNWEALNRFRDEWGLEPIPVPSFNLYVDREQLVETLAERGRVVEVSDFSSSYYVGTRVLKPLLTEALGRGPAAAQPDTEINRWFSHVPAAGDYGIQVLFVFEKPAS
jgi:ubiquinone/menaquinone biosynthesis C-methylase UbiE